MSRKVPVHVEVAVRPSSLSSDTIKQHIIQFINDNEAFFKVGPLQVPSDNPLSTYVETIAVTQCGSAQHKVDSEVSFLHTDLHVHIFQLSDLAPEADVIESPDGEGEAEMSPCTQWILPRRDFEGTWDSLIFDTNIKDKLVEFAAASLRFALSGVKDYIISTNRMVLLHGPPGTGKTTLCKGLAQKLAIRMSHVYSSAILVEIHSHSLFSKWFSESGKLVARLFEHIQELVEEPDTLVIVLIDEVESLTCARATSMNGSEPSDAVRVVNAMLTQLDQLKRFPNVLTLCTTNLASAIDPAFIDRADIKAFIDLPSTNARFAILRDCVQELMRAGLVATAPLCEVPPTTANALSELDARLIACAEAARELSGRSLRKLPFLAFATHLHQSGVATALEFVEALQRTIEDEHLARSAVMLNSNTDAPFDEKSAVAMDSIS